jgi:hypothetical protein
MDVVLWIISHWDHFNIGWDNMTSGQQLTNGILFVAWVVRTRGLSADEHSVACILFSKKSMLNFYRTVQNEVLEGHAEEKR